MRKPILEDARRLTISLGKDQRIFVEKVALMRRTSSATVIRWAVDRLKADVELGDDGVAKQRKAT